VGLHPRPTTGYEVDIILANKTHYRSKPAITRFNLNPTLAVTVQIIALYRNLAK
jgi:hypothetical protein